MINQAGEKLNLTEKNEAKTKSVPACVTRNQLSYLVCAQLTLSFVTRPFLQSSDTDRPALLEASSPKWAAGERGTGNHS